MASSAISSSNAASAQEAAAQSASNTQLQMFNTIQQNESPWVGIGGEANQALAAFYGLPGGSSGTSGGVPGYNSNGYQISPSGGVTRMIPGWSAQGTSSSGSSSVPNFNQILSNLPGYQFQLQQGSQAVERDLAAQGLLQSGAAGKALTQYGQGLAQNYAGQYAQGLMNLSQMGQAGAAGVATAGMNAANQIGSNQIYAGNAAANGASNIGSAINSGLGNMAGIYGYYNAPSTNPYAVGGSAYSDPNLQGAYNDYNSSQGYYTGLN